MSEQERIAEKIFKQYGLEFNTASRPGGWTNAVWLNGDLALRISFKKESERIRREVRLSEYLPSEVGYPINIALGTMDGYEWSLSKRIIGNNLSDVWNQLSWQERTETIQQIIRIIKFVHKVDINNMKHLSNKNAWYSTFNAQETYSCLEKYKEKKIFTPKQIDYFYSVLECFFEKHQTSKHVLNHGDITMDNLLWSNGNIVSLMDFEHSVIAPVELDLHSLINLAFLSFDLSTLNNQLEGYRQYKDAVIEFIKPMLVNTDSSILLLGYAILYRQRFLEFYLENPEGELDNLDAYNILCKLANGKGGYLSEIINL